MRLRLLKDLGKILKRHERRPGSNTCIVMCDIDYFKKVNDTYGHIQGDLVLKKVGDILSESLRGVFDVAGRYGGEEFLLIFDETNEENAFKITERLRKNIEATRFEKADDKGNILEDEFIKITMSFGIASLCYDSKLTASIDHTTEDAQISEEQITSIDWIGRADKALYESKQNGRNQTTIFHNTKN
jgi:diguanylate cyclase (GGDEF)-like protein